MITNTRSYKPWRMGKLEELRSVVTSYITHMEQSTVTCPVCGYSHPDSVQVRKHMINAVDYKHSEYYAE